MRVIESDAAKAYDAKELEREAQRKAQRLRDAGVVKFTCKAMGDYRPYAERDIPNLLQAIKVANDAGRQPKRVGFKTYYLPRFLAELHFRFKAEHEITDEDFASDHWQTIFAIQYPEAVV